MKTNESGVDRGIRAALAVVALILAFTVLKPSSFLGILLIIVAIILGATAAVGFCPLYRVFGISTCKTNR
ncbi:hypothetical protein CATRI_02225 [Corynebacterium atrinae]|uniref:YgaP family membrane protein n=1 Tax=Corynebacterium atrinae TaxID=1336740 RepID=UPI0025B34A7F|nr:DUF2892 domain-containing protein [Corynebacterium atrinae]WJY62550.1 hypothetical protein CATRI_02225 [Corynebacterium atrinae]